MLVRKAGKRERDEQHTLQNKLGKVCAALGKDDKALKAYTAAHQLDLTDQETIRGLAEVCFRLKDWGAALTNYQKVLTALGEDETEERADVYYKLGCIKREQGQAKQAINNFEKALARRRGAPARRSKRSSRSTRSSRTGSRSSPTSGRSSTTSFDGRRALQDARTRSATSGTTRTRTRRRRSRRSKRRATSSRTNHVLLHKLLALYQATENWAKMIDTLQAIAEMREGPEPQERSSSTRWRSSIATRRAIRTARSSSSTRRSTSTRSTSRPSSASTRSSRRKKDWKQLERAFRKMLRRMSTANASNPDLEFNLWHNLGLIYRDRLKDMNSAIEAFKMATRFKPDEAVERQILAELYEATDQTRSGDRRARARPAEGPAARRPVPQPLQALPEACTSTTARGACARRSRSCARPTRKSSASSRTTARSGMIQVKSRLDNEQWVKNLFHKDENLYIGKIFEMITPAAIVAKTQPARKAQKQLPVLDTRFKQDPATSTVTFAKTFGWAAQVLGVPLPGALRPQRRAGRARRRCRQRRRRRVAGQTVLTGFTPQELTFIVGKHLSVYRGEHYIKNLFPTLTELKVILFAGIKIVMPDFAGPRRDGAGSQRDGARSS